jgi:alkyl hydroperoxide reductase subunit AhpC
LTGKEKEKVQILALSIDSQAVSKKFVERLKTRFAGEVDFPLLEDKNHKVIDRYGILNPDGRGWPHPATYIIDKEGVVRSKFVEVDFTQRPSNAQILKALRKSL